MKKKKRCAIKDEELKKELNKFQRHLSREINNTLQRKFRVRKTLKKTYQNDIMKKLWTILRIHIGKLPSELTKEDILDWEAYSYDNYTNNGNMSRFKAMNKLLDYLHHSDWKLKLPPIEEKRYKTLTESERDRYIKTVNDSCNGILDKPYDQLKPRDMKRIMDRTLVLMQALLECRPSELCDIKIKNIDFERHRIYLEDSKTHELLIRRNMEDALVLTPLTTQAIKDWLRIRQQYKDDPENPYLFIYTYGKYKGRRVQYNRILDVCKEFGVKADVSITTNPYTLKRTEITRDCSNNNNIAIPQTRARHTSFKSTLRYNHKNTDDVIDYIKSDEYNDLSINEQKKVSDGLKQLAEKVAMGEIPIETYNQLRQDLQLDTIKNKHNDKLPGYL